MRTSPQAVERSPEGQGLLPFHRTVVATRRVAASYSDVERVVRIRLSKLIETAFPSPNAPPGYGLVSQVSMRHWFRRVRVLVDVEVESVYHPRPGLIAHLRWRAHRHGKVFPVMEADLLARPGPEAGTELVLAGTYHPPFGTLGVLGDLVVGRLVAQSTAEKFIDGLSIALEATFAEIRAEVGSGRLNEKA
jgi:hypothetical protein